MVFFFFFKQKTAYEIVSRDWSSDVCSSDLQFWMSSMTLRHFIGYHVKRTVVIGAVAMWYPFRDRKSVV